METVVAVLTGKMQPNLVLSEEFRRRGTTVFSGDTRTPSTLAGNVRDAGNGVDLLIVCPPTQAPQPDYPELDFDRLRQTYDTNALDVLRSVEALLPLMKQGKKRLCFVLEGDPLQEDLAATNDLGDAMAKAAITMAYKNLYNDLRREGYTFRLFRPTLEIDRDFAPVAVDYFLSDDGNENRLVIRKASGKETVL